MHPRYIILFFVVVLVAMGYYMFWGTKSDEVIKEAVKEEPEPVDSIALLLEKYGLDYLQGKFNPSEHPAFEKMEGPYTERGNMYLRTDAYQSFKKMHAEAKKEGIRLVVRSATRNFDRQRQIWEGKWNGTRSIEGGGNAAVDYPDPLVRAKKILLYSSMPGTSRHHWGTDIDINMFENSYFENGEGLTVYEWLNKNAYKFGYCQVYNKKGEGRKDGYNEEKWHWSYLPVADELTRLCEAILSNDSIRGFKGAQTAKEIEIIEKYVLGLNQACH